MAVGVWYGHKLTTTFIMSQLPSGWPQRPEDAAYFPDGWLKGKGWPTFERAWGHAQTINETAAALPSSCDRGI